MARKNFPIASIGSLLAVCPWFRGIEGAEHFRGVRAGIVASNHSSLLDGLVMTTSFSWVTRRPLHTISHAQPFNHWLMGWVLRSNRCIPLVRASSSGTEMMMRTALAWLRMGEAVGIFPEGHINRRARLRRPRLGTALMALESGAPVIPIGIVGSRDAWPLDRPRPRLGYPVRVRVGPPLSFSDAADVYHGSSPGARKSLAVEVTTRIMEAIADQAGVDPPKRIA